MITFLLVVFFLGIVGFGPYWFYRSHANYVDGNQLGIRVINGEPDLEVYKPGARLFIPWLPKAFKCYLKTYPMGMFDLDYDPIKVMSKAGDYGGQKYGSVELTIETRAYLNFPREREMLVNKDTDEPVGFLGEGDLSAQQRQDLQAGQEVVWRGVTVVLEKTHPLIKIFRNGIPVPDITAETPMAERDKQNAKLEDWTKEGMLSSVRASAAQMPWGEANENTKTAFKDKVEKCFLDADGALIQAGFRPSGIKIAIQLVDPPGTVKEALAKEEAAPHVARREAIENGDPVLQMVEKAIAAEGGHVSPQRRKQLRQECLNQINRERTMKGGGRLVDNRIANADGTSFAPGSLSELVGGIVVAAAASLASKDGGGQGKGGKGNNGRSNEKSWEKMKPGEGREYLKRFLAGEQDDDDDEEEGEKKE